jgi:hypothetical protein
VSGDKKKKEGGAAAAAASDIGGLGQVDLKEEVDRRKKRAERFGMPVPVLKEEVRFTTHSFCDCCMLWCHMRPLC